MNRMEVERRVFLGTVVAFLAGARRARAAQGSAYVVRPLAAALKAARKDGRPLLVLVAPEAIRAREKRARIWGALFAKGSPEVQADLALCEVTCADMRTARRGLAGGRELVGEPWALLVDGESSTVRALAGDVRDVGLTARIREQIRFWAQTGSPERRERIPILSAHPRTRLWPATPSALGDGHRAPCAGGPCGTAYVPTASRRFLRYFTQL